MLSRNLEQTIHRALSLASERRHEYATLEHLLRGLVDDIDAAPVLYECGVDLVTLRETIDAFLNEDLAGLATNKPGDPKPTAGFQRVLQSAAIHVQGTGQDEQVTGANVLVALFSERESHAVYFLDQQNMTRLKAIKFISHGNARVDPPPSLPRQGIGPHVEIGPDGIITFSSPEALDVDGNHLPRLRALHPDLRELASGLVISLGKGNVPHAALCQRVIAYSALIDQELQSIDFRRLYAAGVRLANAAHTTTQAISDGDLPPLPTHARGEMESLLALHGAFILATSAGTEALLDEERYRRRTTQEQQLRADTVAVVTAMQSRPDIIAPDVAAQVLGAAREIGTGGNPERSTVIGKATFRNVMISIAGGAIGSVAFGHMGMTMSGMPIVLGWLGLLAANETVKKTHWFQKLTSSASLILDGIADVSAAESLSRLISSLVRHKNFMLDNEETLSRLANENADLEFLDEALQWLDTLAKDRPLDDEKE